MESSCADLSLNSPTLTGSTSQMHDTAPPYPFQSSMSSVTLHGSIPDSPFLDVNDGLDDDDLQSSDDEGLYSIKDELSSCSPVKSKSNSKTSKTGGGAGADGESKEELMEEKRLRRLIRNREAAKRYLKSIN